MTKLSLAFAIGLGLGALAGCADDPRKAQIAWSENIIRIEPGENGQCLLSDENGIPYWGECRPEPFLIPGTDTPLQP